MSVEEFFIICLVIGTALFVVLVIGGLVILLGRLGV